MLTALQLIKEVKKGNTSLLRDHKWLSYLFLTKEQNVNLEQVESLEQMAKNPVLNYVEKTLQILNDMDISDAEKTIIEEVLMWSEVSKCGLPHKRKEWQQKGYQLAIHNIGSAQIYAEEKLKIGFSNRNIQREELIHTLILTHGAIGQLVRGEVRYRQLTPLVEWVQQYKENTLHSFDIGRLLYKLNQCIIEAVSTDIWKSVRSEVELIIGLITEKEKHHEQPLKIRLKKLRKSSISKGEDFNSLYQAWFTDKEMVKHFPSFFRKIDLWYVESALQDFTFEEFLKIFLLIYRKADPLSLQQISFEPFMKDIYYDYKGKKAVNLYKKRIIEAYLREVSMHDLLKGDIPENDHVSIEVSAFDLLNEVVGVKFSYSKAGEKLIEFCQEAEKSPLYERSIVLLYDFFGFRKDSFDRLQNEQNYLSEMNSSQDHKKIISDFAVGEMMVDIGAGGGVMLDVLSEHHKQATVVGIDISTNVIEELKKKKIREQKRWDVEQADALNLSDYFDRESVDTIVFSSILHEMFSYIPYEGKKFNHNVISKALQSAFDILKAGGRIIIRDGIMSQPSTQMRRLEFHEPSGMDFFKRYVKDFKGRKIKWEQISRNSVELPINDAMEFLYTYTWGEESYPHEVQEQFGYFTPSQYKKVISETLGERARIIKFEHYLQDGYEEFILPKVSIKDVTGESVKLPDSTCFIVIEKQ